MKVLIVGAGVIGTVYGAHLGAAGHQVSVAAHGPRTATVARDGLLAHDLTADLETRASVVVVDDPCADAYELIIVTVGRDHLDVACRAVATAAGDPTVLIFGNNPFGRAALPDLPGHGWQGFPGVGGTLVDGVARYVPIRQQPTTVAAGPNPVIAEFTATVRQRGLAVRAVTDMDGWLALPRHLCRLRRRRPTTLRHRPAAAGHRPDDVAVDVPRHHRGLPRPTCSRPPRAAPQPRRPPPPTADPDRGQVLGPLHASSDR